KPGAERSRRRRGTDEDIERKKRPVLFQNPSELSDEELNDDLLQSDDEDVNMGGQHVSLNATYSLNTSYEHHDSLQEDEYTGDVGDDGYQQGEYAEDYGQDAEVPEDPMEYNEELGQEEEGYQDGVLDIQINEPLDGEFQDSEYQSSYNDEPLHEDAVQQEEAPEEVGLGGEQQEEEEAVETEEAKEESDEEDDDTEESGRLRFKSERKESVGVRLADAGSKRRNIPETLGTLETSFEVIKNGPVFIPILQCQYHSLSSSLWSRTFLPIDSTCYTVEGWDGSLW
uniref:Uncharacterized protein n=1 Tax=Cynoglossus semilaevis TaxID=244447 RepID=A0A3P8ULB7_CYNSE